MHLFDNSHATISLAADRTVPAPPTSKPVLSSERLLSIDALRGFVMFWLIGGRELALSVIACLYPPWFDAWEIQLTHPKWHGPVSWDLVMPLFLFVTGISIPLAMARLRTRGTSPAPDWWRIARRIAVLWILGMLLQAGKPDMQGLELYSNTLQAIAVGYLVTSLALQYLSKKGQVLFLAVLLVGYGALLLLMPYPGHLAGLLEKQNNLPLFIDKLVLGSFRRNHAFAWLLPSLGFSAMVLLGAMAGHLLRSPLAAKSRLLVLLAIGTGCMAAGWFWSAWLPMNRYIWTGSFVLWAGGIGFWLMALFHGVIDNGKLQRWAFPLVVIGGNALLAFTLDPLFMRISSATAALLAGQVSAAGLDILKSLVELAGLWLLLWLLYRKRIFFRA